MKYVVGCLGILSHDVPKQHAEGHDYSNTLGCSTYVLRNMHTQGRAHTEVVHTHGNAHTM